MTLPFVIGLCWAFIQYRIEITNINNE
jgi:hypothetical protein